MRNYEEEGAKDISFTGWKCFCYHWENEFAIVKLCKKKKKKYYEEYRKN